MTGGESAQDDAVGVGESGEQRSHSRSGLQLVDARLKRVGHVLNRGITDVDRQAVPNLCSV